jgi:hypothetical protein
MDALISCVNSSSTFTRPIVDDSIVYAMFASPEVYSYASHTMLVNGAFFEYNGYAARLLSKETGDDWHPKDRRWNKVRAIVRAFQQQGQGSEGVTGQQPHNSAWAHNTRALVFIDTDLLLLDWSLDVTTLLDKHAQADLILSADALDVGNTGFLIVRNTEWAVSFFNEWWESRLMKHTFCDQHVLNKLYSALTKKNMAHKVQVLPNNAVNSRWPAIETMADDDRVLHLMGETTPFRAAIAAHASTVVCAGFESYQRQRDTRIGGTGVKDGKSERMTMGQEEVQRFYQDYVPHQLGFSREKLVQLSRDAILAEMKERYRRAASPLAKEDDFHRLHAANTNACDDKRPYLSSSALECEGFFNDEYELVKATLHRVSGSGRGKDRDQDEAEVEVEVEVEVGGKGRRQRSSDNDDVTSSSTGTGTGSNTNSSSSFRLFLMDHMAKTLHDTIFFAPLERKGAAAAKALSALEALREEVDMHNPVNRVYFEHKKALVHNQLAAFHFNRGDWPACLDGTQVAINAMTEVLSLCEEKSPDFPGYVLEYVDSAARAAEAFSRLQQYEEALDWAQAALKNAEVLFSTYRGEERVIAQDLARLHSLVAEMLIHNPHIKTDTHSHLDLASREIALARMSKLTFDVEHDLPAAMKRKMAELKELIQKKREERLV